MEPADKSCVYGLRHQARCLTAVHGDKERNKFLVGTLDIRPGQNEIHLLDFDEDDFEVSSQVFRHPHEIWNLSCCPARPDLFFSCYSMAGEQSSEMRATLWRLPTVESGRDSGSKALTEVLTLNNAGTDSTTKCVLWDPTEDMTKLVSVDDTTLRVWSLGQNMTSATASNAIQVPLKGMAKITKAAWNTHSPQVATIAETSVRGWDLRSMSQTFCIEQAHTAMVRDLDYNPNKPHQIATGGDDCKVRIWDTRNCEVPVKEISHHTHWVWSVAFNRYHDQLFLTTGSDCLVNLHSLLSVSSAQYNGTTEDEDKENQHKNSGNRSPVSPTRKSYEKSERMMDGLVQTYDQQHEESVYCGAWSAADPWIFASLSYDGRVVIDFVPTGCKNNILFSM